MNVWRRSLTTGVAVAAACVCAASWASAARAEIFVTASDGIHTGSADDSSTPGQATFNGSIGNFTLSIDVGIGFPAAGSASDPTLNLASINVAGGAGGALTVSLTETGFGPTTATEFRSSISGSYSGSNATLSTYFDTLDTQFGTGTELASGLLNNQFVYTSAPPISGPYSLTEIIKVTAGAGSFTGLDASIINVPEPGSASFVAAALLVLVGLARTRPRAATDW